MFFLTEKDQISLDKNEFFTMTTFRDLSGLPVNNDRLEFILGNSPLTLCRYEERCLAKILQYCRYIGTSGRNNHFRLSARRLAKLVMEIDCLPSHLGFRHQEILHRECKLLVPFIIDERADLHQVLRPVINLRNNQKTLQCNFLETALILSIIHRLVRANERLATADWSLIINEILATPDNSLTMAVNDACQAAIAEVEGA